MIKVLKVPGSFFGSIALLLPTFALAQSQLAQNIPAKDNPRFLPHFLERFSDGFRTQTRFPQPEMPENLREFWRDNMAEPRDFAEEIAPGVKWPRFQWGIQATPTHSASSKVLPVYQWFDVRNPERLVREWNKAFCFDKEKTWVGVTWLGDRSSFEFYIKDAQGYRVRRYRNEKFTDEYRIDFKNGSALATANGRTLYTQSSVGRIAPQFTNPQAAHLQFNIQREFLIFPRTYARASNGEWERVYFP